MVKGKKKPVARITTLVDQKINICNDVTWFDNDITWH